MVSAYTLSGIRASVQLRVHTAGLLVQPTDASPRFLRARRIDTPVSRRCGDRNECHVDAGGRPETTAEGFEVCAATNYLGPYLLTLLLLPQLRRSAKVRPALIASLT